MPDPASLFRGCQADPWNAVIRGGPYPDRYAVYITQLYGWVNPDHSPGPNGYAFHFGLDLVPYFDYQTNSNISAMGVPLLAMGYGTVTGYGYNVEPGNGRGWWIEVSYHGMYLVRYYHMQIAALVAVGSSVTPGQLIGYTGSTGNSSGPHLHMEIDCLPPFAGSVDPFAFLINLRELGYVPPMPLPTGVPYVWFDGYLGSPYSGPGWAAHDFGMTIQRQQNGQNGQSPWAVQFIPQGVDGQGKEHFILRIDNGP